MRRSNTDDGRAESSVGAVQAGATLTWFLSWVGGGAAMAVHIVGVLLGWWTHVSLTWWIALAFLLAFNASTAVMHRVA